MTTHRGSTISQQVERPLLEPDCDVFIRYNEAISILYKVRQYSESSFEPLVSSRKPFGFDTLFRGSKHRTSESVKLFENGGTSFVNKLALQKGQDIVDRYKVYIPEAGSGSDSFPHPILGRPFLGEPNTACTETYLVIGPFNDEEECKNVISYISTRFFRFLVMLKKPSQHATSKVYSFVPLQDFSRSWTDADLYAKYNLTDDEIAFIESMIKPMELGGDDNA